MLKESELVEIWLRHSCHGGDVISFGQEVASLAAKRAREGDKRSTPPPSRKMVRQQPGGTA